jgi:hypothetical protein
MICFWMPKLPLLTSAPTDARRAPEGNYLMIRIMLHLYVDPTFLHVVSHLACILSIGTSPDFEIFYSSDMDGLYDALFGYMSGLVMDDSRKALELFSLIPHSASDILPWCWHGFSLSRLDRRYLCFYPFSLCRVRVLMFTGGLRSWDEDDLASARLVWCFTSSAGVQQNIRLLTTGDMAFTHKAVIIRFEGVYQTSQSAFGSLLDLFPL